MATTLLDTQDLAWRDYYRAAVHGAIDILRAYNMNGAFKGLKPILTSYNENVSLTDAEYAVAVIMQEHGSVCIGSVAVLKTLLLIYGRYVGKTTLFADKTNTTPKALHDLILDPDHFIQRFPYDHKDYVVTEASQKEVRERAHALRIELDALDKRHRYDKEIADNAKVECMYMGYERTVTLRNTLHDGGWLVNDTYTQPETLLLYEALVHCIKYVMKGNLKVQYEIDDALQAREMLWKKAAEQQFRHRLGVAATVIAKKNQKKKKAGLFA